MKRSISSLCGFVIASLFAPGTALQAQLVIDSAPSAPAVPATLRDEAAASPFALPGGVAASPALLHWGPADIKPHAFERFIYSDGIQSVPGHPANSYINSLSVGISADIGRHWTFDYSPTWMVYTNRAFQDSVNHSLSIGAGYAIGDWLGQFSQSYSKSNNPLIETGRQTSQETSSTNLNFSHRFNDHLSLEVGGTQNLQYVKNAPNSYDWSNNDWLTYRFVSRLEASIGLRMGYTDFDPGAYMTYTEPRARIRWRATDKLTLSVEGGRQTYKIHRTGIPSQSTPTFSGSLDYAPFEQTVLSIGAERTVAPSYFSNSVTESRGWHVDLQQRLLGYLSLSAGIGGQKTHYSGSHTVLIPNVTFQPIYDTLGNIVGITTVTTYTPTTFIDLRDDSSRSFHTRLSAPFMGRGSVSLLYDRSRNSSSIPGYSFTSHQIGVELGYRF